MKIHLVPAAKIFMVFTGISIMLLSCTDNPAQVKSADELSGKSADESSGKSFEQPAVEAEKKSDVLQKKSYKKTVGKMEVDAALPVKNVNTAINKKPVHLTKQDFLDKVMNYEKNPDKWIFKGDLPCLIDFYADWCAPCRITAPILEELAESYAGRINIYKIDIEREKELASVFGIRGIPAFLFCPLEGTPGMTSGIARTAEETKQLFIKQIDSLLLNKKNATEL